MDLEKCLKCGIVLVKANPSKDELFVTTIIKLYLRPMLSGSAKNLFMQALGSIGDTVPGIVVKILPDLCRALDMSVSDVHAEGSTVV